MKRILLISWVMVLMFIVIESPSAGNPEILVSGQVIQHSYQLPDINVPGVTITISDSKSTIGITTTDTNGNYSFHSGVANGSYTITPSMAGYTFCPASIQITVNNANITQIFTAFSGSIKFYKGQRIMASCNGAIVRDSSLKGILFTQEPGVHGTIVSTQPMQGAAGGFIGNFYQIHWDSAPQSPKDLNLNLNDNYSTASEISAVPSPDDQPQPNYDVSQLETIHYTKTPYWPKSVPNKICITNIECGQMCNPDTLMCSPEHPSVKCCGPQKNEFCCGPQAAECLGDCTWYTYGRMLDLGYSEVNLKFALNHFAEKWASAAVAYLGTSCCNKIPSVGAIAHRRHCLDTYDNTIKIGHVAVVESVNADGSITVTESNLHCDLTSVSDYLWRHRTIYPPVIDPDVIPQCVKFSDFIHIP
ncbi:MAG: CHAP domain-containing protein [Syntrophales bacterium]